MPLVTIRLGAGRDTDAIRELVERVSHAAADALELPVERVTVHVFELAPDRVGKGGRLASEC